MQRRAVPRRGAERGEHRRRRRRQRAAAGSATRGWPTRRAIDWRRPRGRDPGRGSVRLHRAHEPRPPPIARELNLDPEERHTIALASRLHDVGKIAVPDAILLKKGESRPTRSGAVVERHCAVGHEILSAAGSSDPQGRRRRSLLTHHEWFDGPGIRKVSRGRRSPPRPDRGDRGHVRRPDEPQALPPGSDPRRGEGGDE